MAKRLYLSIIILVPLFLGSCQLTQTAQPANQNTQNGSVENIRVTTVQPSESLVKTETFPLPNCGGTGEIRQTLGSTASITKSVTLSGKATVRGGGEAGIPETVKLKLEIEIEAAYQKAYEAANSRLDTIDMPAAAGTHVIYDIGWYEQVFNSIVQYSMDGQVYEAPYTYKLQVPKLDNSRQVFCGTSTKSANAPTLPKSTSTPVSEKETNTPVPLPTSTPTSMQTGPRTVGDGFSDGNISLILTDYTIDSNTIDLIFVVKNESNRDILVRYQNSYFTLSDSTGKEYEHITQCEFDTKQELISSGKSVEIERGAPNMACRFDYLSYFKGTISESAEFLLVNVSKFMGLENVQWRIDL